MEQPLLCRDPRFRAGVFLLHLGDLGSTGQATCEAQPVAPPMCSGGQGFCGLNSKSTEASLCRRYRQPWPRSNVLQKAHGAQPTHERQQLPALREEWAFLGILPPAPRRTPTLPFLGRGAQTRGRFRSGTITHRTLPRPESLICSEAHSPRLPPQPRSRVEQAELVLRRAPFSLRCGLHVLRGLWVRNQIPSTRFCIRDLRNLQQLPATHCASAQSSNKPVPVYLAEAFESPFRGDLDLGIGYWPPKLSLFTRQRFLLLRDPQIRPHIYGVPSKDAG